MDFFDEGPYFSNKIFEHDANTMKLSFFYITTLEIEPGPYGWE